MVTGSRHWTDGLRIRDVLACYWSRAPVVVHGNCEGADLIAAEVAEGLGFEVIPFPPDTKQPVPQRYHARNDRMLALADLVLAFRLVGAENRGTDSVIRKAEKLGIAYSVFEATREDV